MPNLQWKLMEDITPEDHLILNRNAYLFGEKNVSLQKLVPKSLPREKKITLPKTMNTSLAFLLGALVAEGSFHQKKIIFNNSDMTYYNKVKQAILQNFPNTQLYERDVKGNCKELEIYHQRVVRFLSNLGFKQTRSAGKEIPFTVLQSTKQVVKSFLIGLYEGDGSVKVVSDKRHGGKSVQLTYDSKSKKLIGQLKTILLNFGIITNLPKADKRSDCYRIIIPGANNVEQFRKEIGFYSARKKGILQKVEGMNKSRMSKVDYVPHLTSYLRSNYSTEFIKKNNFDRYNNLEKNRARLAKTINKSELQMVNWLLSNHFFFDKVSSIKKLAKKETVYSIKVDSACHSFVANGFINHNTEAKLQKISSELLQDIEKNTVDFKDNFDGSMKEPSVLPNKLPNLLINGSSGIAVGMATNIPPHNVNEICDAVIKLIENSETTVEELIEIVPGPDFPTGGEVSCGGNLRHAYMHGKGKVVIKAISEIEDHKIIITEIPYQVNKAELIIHIANLVKDKKIVGIRNINDESDREGIRVVIDLKRDVDPQVILNQLYKYSRLRVTFGMNMLALVDNKPRMLGLKDILEEHIKHRKEVITRRTQYDLEQAQKKIHLLEGLLVAIDNIDQVIPGIRQSKTIDEAKEFLTGNYNLSELQAKAILEMKLQKLASLEQEKIRNDHKNLLEMITYYESVLEDVQKILDIIKGELEEIKNNYGDGRRSRIIEGDYEDVDMEDLIKEETMVVTMTNSGYVKRIPLDTYKTQKRGGKGVRATGMKEEDFVEKIYITSTHAYLLFFTDQGQVYWQKVYHVPEGSRQAKGKHVSNLLEMKQGEKINAVIPIRNFEDGFLFMATQKGTVKKTELAAFSKPRKGGIRAINLDEDDELVKVKFTTGDHEILLATREGFANRFNENTIRAMGRTARGVRGIRLKSVEDYVVGMLAADEGKEILTLTEKGYGKRTPVSEYRLCNRGGKGVTNIKVTDKNGSVNVVMLVDGSEELMMMSKNGIAIRMKCSDISTIGRATQGVRVMRLGEDDLLVAAAKIDAEEEVENNEEEVAGGVMGKDISSLEDGEVSDVEEVEFEVAEEVQETTETEEPTEQPETTETEEPQQENTELTEDDIQDYRA